jgi:hypothetical protein
MTTPKPGIPPFIYMLGFTVFIVMVANIWMVTRSNSMDVDVVRTDYYAESLKHDLLLNAQHRVDSLKLDILLRMQNGQASVEWRMGGSGSVDTHLITKLKCVSHFYRSDDSRLDQTVTMLQDTLVPAAWKGFPKPLMPGPWKISVRWYLDTLLFLEKPFKYSS